MSGIVETCQKVGTVLNEFQIRFTSYRAIIIFGKCRTMNTKTMDIMIFASVKSMLWLLDPFNLRDFKIIFMFRTMIARRGRKQVVVVGCKTFKIREDLM